MFPLENEQNIAKILSENSTKVLVLLTMASMGSPAHASATVEDTFFVLPKFLQARLDGISKFGLFLLSPSKGAAMPNCPCENSGEIFKKFRIES